MPHVQKTALLPCPSKVRCPSPAATPELPSGGGGGGCVPLGLTARGIVGPQVIMTQDEAELTNSNAHRGQAGDINDGDT